MIGAVTMRIPETVNILGVVFNVVQQKDIVSDGDECMGCCEFTTQTIRLKQDLGDDMKGVVLLHEILEALNENLKLRLKHDIMDTLDIGLYQVLKENDLRFNDNNH